MASLISTSAKLFTPNELLVHDKLDHHRQLLTFLKLLAPYRGEYVYIKEAYKKLYTKVQSSERLFTLAINQLTSPLSRDLLVSRYLRGVSCTELAKKYYMDPKAILLRIRGAISDLTRVVVKEVARGGDLEEWEIEVS